MKENEILLSESVLIAVKVKLKSKNVIALKIYCPPPNPLFSLRASQGPPGAYHYKKRALSGMPIFFFLQNLIPFLKLYLDF